MGDSERQADLQVAIDAVRAASRVCRQVQQRLVTAEQLEKKDKSPVTVADFASQAIVCHRLNEAKAGDRIVGEEDAGALRDDAQASLRAQITAEVSGELGRDCDEATVLTWIDLGADDASGGRYWTLDPIDGTKGFLRGEQYAVALGLLEDGEVVLGVLGCPNLPLGDGEGALFTALRGEGAQVHPLWEAGDAGESISVASIQSVAEARFCESVESGHSDQSESARIACALGITGEPFRIDSQCKYATVARADASIYLRLPTRAKYREKIWDHAAGMIIVEEAGGRVSDIHGNALDFTCGRTLEKNRGVVATSGAIHDDVIAAIGSVRD